MICHPTLLNSTKHNQRKPLIYQIFTRLYGNNQHTANIPNGTIEENGCAKLNGITQQQLQRISYFGFTHVWFTGLLEHATQTDYSAFGIAKDHPSVVKGKAGSPYAIKDYYDIDPDLAVNVKNRMREFDALLRRTHKAGLKMVIDFVPNHVATRHFLPTTISITSSVKRSTPTLIPSEMLLHPIRNIQLKLQAMTASAHGPAVMIGTKP